MAKRTTQRRARRGVGEKHGKLYLTFTWRGVRCKEYVTDAATEVNRKHWDTRAALINAQIKAGAFDYRAWFPNGTKISIFYPDSTPPATAMTVQDWVHTWHASRSPFRADGALMPDAGLHPTTWLHNGSIITHWIVPQLGMHALTALTKSHCLDFKRVLETSVSGKTVLNTMGVLHKALEDAIERDLITTNPVPKLKTPRGWSHRLRKTSKPLVAEEVQRFLAALPARVDLQDGAFVTGDMLWDVYYLWFHTGWRSNEIMAIEFDALSWHRQVVEIRKGRSPRHGGLEAAPKTGEREVVCDYDPMLFTIFERRRRESLATGHRQYVFSDSRGRPLSQEWLAKRVWHPTLRQIGVSARGQYNIRDTFISLALSAGEDPGWVAQVCGTSEQMIFRHYRTWMPSLRRGRGRLLAQTLEIGPKIGPKGGVRGPSVRKIKDLRSGGGGNRTPMGDHSREEEVSPTRVSAI